MYLKSIEVHGFKSFANKILFEFKHGITGIVGPNGSGKSNVADAVRWVLGEQSAKQLRGGSMQDVIFSGTQMRKPLGFAYVAITLDNSDHKLPVEYEQVTVARRVYRSGESEYLINGHSCRLRDVQELFLDTGIGKEGYSIIGQGQIDKILSGKPEDRRELFDEAAGIVKFKKRKAMAERDLDAERLNLSRVNDILSELEKQIGPLEKQSLVAKEYLKYKENLKRLEVNQFLIEHEKNQENKKQVEERLQIVTNDLEQTKQKYDAVKEEYEQLELILEEQNQLLEKEKQKKNELLLEIRRLEGEIQVVKEQITSIAQNDAHYKERFDIVLTEIKEKQEELEKYKKEKQSVEERFHDLEKIQQIKVKKLGEIQIGITQYEQEIEACNAEIIRLLNEISVIKSNIGRYETIKEQNNIKKAEINQRILRNKSEESNLEQGAEQKRERLKQAETAIEKQNIEVASLEEQIKERQAEIEKKTAVMSAMWQEYLSVNAKLDSLKNLTERYDGYGTSIKRVMEQKTQMSGIVGVVADIIKADKNYEMAIEVALGGSIQNIVTDNETTAKELIQFLKRNKFGRATFLPLTSISGNVVSNKEVLKETGVIGLASSLVYAEKKFDGLIRYLLGRILVVDEINHALVIAKKYNYTLRIVTLDGEQLNPGGSLSGGAYKNSSNLLGRRREMEELEQKAAKLKKEQEQEQVKLEQIQQLEIQQRSLLEQGKAKLQELHVEQNTAKMNLNQEEEKIEKVKQVFIEYSKELKELEGQNKELKENLEALKFSLEQNIQANKEKEVRIEACNQLLSKQKKAEKEEEEFIADLKIKLSNLEQNNQYVVFNIKRIKAELEKFLQEEQNLKESEQNSKQQRQEREQQIIESEKKIEKQKAELEKTEQQIVEYTAKKDEMTANHKKFFTRREELSENIARLDKDLFRLQNQKEKLIDQINAQISYLWEEYELTPSAAIELKEEIFSNLIQNKKEILELKNKIKSLGDVNVNAIEDFKALSERFEFLKTQHEDLQKSEQTLVGIITELDEEMRKQFEEKFNQIKVQFDLVFKELFGGGKGTLELTEEEDILEAGVRIIAQPPGKKLQNMMQLSGGEKALTAISLLFAIQNLKPSPFCLLDEIEAALDDSNVKRYASYLHKLTKDTQFIVITHRRGTMAAANILYGITMQEKGVSTLVSVSLIEDKLEK